MSLRSESEFQESCLKELRALPRSWWEKIDQKSKRGTPDALGCVNGTFVAIEFKRSFQDSNPKKKGNALQLYVLKCIKKAGGVAMVAYPENWHKVLRKVKSL